MRISHFSTFVAGVCFMGFLRAVADDDSFWIIWNVAGMAANIGCAFWIESE